MSQVARSREGRWLARPGEPLRLILPPMHTFRSGNGAVSPIGNLFRWLDQLAGCEVQPADALLHEADLALLLGEQRRWLSLVHRLRGRRLERAVALSDVAGAPLAARRVVAPGTILVRPGRS